MHDPLSEVLRTLKFEGAVYLHGEFSAPWCARAQYGIPLAHVLMSGADHVVSFHVLIKGHCRARMVDGDAAVDLAAGDLVMFVADDRHHLIGTDLALPALDADAAFADGLPAGVLQLGHGGGGEVTQIICGYLACNRRMTRPLLSALAPMQKIRLCDDGDTAWLLDLLHLGVRESRSGRSGARSALARLSELIFVEALRRHLDALPGDADGWLAGLRDPAVGRALALMHGEPGSPWTMDGLAARVGASRSVLAARFVRLLGEPPMQYLARHRMATAAQMLATGSVGVACIAEAVGYGSEAAFSRAFKRQFALSPARWRREQGAGESPRP